LVSKGIPNAEEEGFMHWFKMKGLLLVFCIPLLTASLSLHTGTVYGSPKIPGVKKKKETQKKEHTFVGKIKSIDIKNRVLVLTTTEGDQEETFNYKKGVRITSAHKAGDLKVSDLTAGMLVTLYMKSSKSSSEVYEILLM
jgi:hypothetical protein